MAILNIRNFNDASHRRLRMRAARNGRSMEAEARAILEQAVAADAGQDAVVAADLQQFVADLYEGDLPQDASESLIAARREEAANEASAVSP